MYVNSYPLVKLDLTLPPEELVVNLINHDNGTEFTPAQLKFDIPFLLDKGRHNSKVKISATPHSYFTGSTNLSYNRIDIQAVVDGKNALFELTTENTIADLIAQIDARFFLKLTTADYIDGPLPAIDEASNVAVPLDLIAAPTSLVYINKAALQIKLANLIQLSTVLTSYILNGLTYNKPIPPLPQLIDNGYYQNLVLRGSLDYHKPALSALIDY